jgi:hypothetical protein
LYRRLTRQPLLASRRSYTHELLGSASMQPQKWVKPRHYAGFLLLIASTLLIIAAFSRTWHGNHGLLGVTLKGSHLPDIHADYSTMLSLDVTYTEVEGHQEYPASKRNAFRILILLGRIAFASLLIVAAAALLGGVRSILGWRRRLLSVRSAAACAGLASIAFLVTLLCGAAFPDRMYQSFGAAFYIFGFGIVLAVGAERWADALVSREAPRASALRRSRDRDGVH